MHIVQKGLEYSERALTALCVLGFAVMFILGIATILFRFVLSVSLAFPDELILYLFVWTTFLGSAVALRRNAHAAIEIFVEWLPGRPRRGALLVASGFSIAFFGVLLGYGSLLSLRVIPQTSPALEISMAWAYGAVPVGAFFLLIYAIEIFAKQLVVPAADLLTESA